MSKQIIWIGLIFLLAFTACKKQKSGLRKSIDGKSTAYLVDQVKANEIDFKTFSTKADFKIKREDKNQSFKANVHIQKDSAIWISITPLLGIEVARVLITKDTVKVINRLAKEYFLGDFSYLQKRFNIDLEYDVIQSILVGNSIPFELSEDIRFTKDKSNFYLGNMKKRKARKVDDNPQKVERRDEQVVSLWIDQVNFKLRKFLLSDLSADRFLLGEYASYEEVESQLVPKNLNFQFQSNEATYIEIDYSRVYLNKSLNFSFNISSKYEQVYY
jgi:hypothetical protein